MNPQDPLAALAPLREPPPPGWWPPAPGWWLLLGLLLLALAALLWWLWRGYRARAYRRQALHQLQALAAQYRRDGDGRALLAATNTLLKAVALKRYPPELVAASSGADWVAFLNRSGGRRGQPRFEAALADALYRPGPPGVDLEQLQRAAARWIRCHGALR